MLIYQVILLVIGGYLALNKVYIPIFLLGRIGWKQWLGNGLVAFTLEMTGFSLIGSTGALILPLLGVVVVSAIFPDMEGDGPDIALMLCGIDCCDERSICAWRLYRFLPSPHNRYST
jgi:hypothetical protein